jgi:hypothetical protein
MAQLMTLRGADIKIFINGKLFPTAQSVTYTIDYGETETYGIDSLFPQEIAPTRVSVSGTITGIRIQSGGGLQGAGLINKVYDLLRQPYISIRIADRTSDSNILYIQNTKVANEQFSAQIKGVCKLTFSFKGMIPFGQLDLE